MGIVIQEVTFDAPAPTAARVVAKLTELVGLPLTISESTPEIRGSLFELHAQLAFARFPQVPVELTAYRAGAVQEHLQRTGMNALPFASVVQGSNEAVGTQTVYVRGYIGQEPTLLLAATLALEALGGRLREPLSDELRREYGAKVLPEELERRHRRVRRQGLLALTAGIVLLPFLVPFWLASIAWHLANLPWRLWKYITG